MIVKVFHGSKCDFNKINLYESFDIGFHCGTLNQAVARIADFTSNPVVLAGSYIYEVNICVNSKNTITMEDCIQWGDFKKVKASMPDIGIDFSECETLADIRDKLVENGYEHIRYKNEVEGDGYSYILLTECHEIHKYTVDGFLYLVNQLLQAYPYPVSGRKEC